MIFFSCSMIAMNLLALENNKPQGQGEPLIHYCPAYNAPAVVGVNPKHWKDHTSSVAGFIDASFIYWNAGEEGLALAETGVLNAGNVYFAQNTRTLFQSFDYQPGFKVGAGIVGYQDWMLRAEYTWFRGHNRTSSGAPFSGAAPTAGTATAGSGAPVWVINDWFLQGTPTHALPGSAVSSDWQLSLDLADLVASRPFYQGRHLIVSPFGGLRSAFIRQSMTVNLTEAFGVFSALSPQPIQSRNHSHSWAIGPRGGVGVACLLPMGFRIEGDFAMSLLYTKYNVKHSEDVASRSYNTGPYTVSYSGYQCLRPELDLGLGLGWGRYLHNQDFWIDFSTDYDFMIFWTQNMMRKLLDDTLTGTGPSASDLYLHGLTVKGCFHF